MILLVIAVAAGAFWLGRSGRFDPPTQRARPPAPGSVADPEVVQRRVPVWPWVAGAAALGVLLLCVAAGPPGLFCGPGLFGGLIGP